MTYKQHLVCGAGFFSGIYLLIPNLLLNDFKSVISMLLISLVGAMVPDSDHPHAHYTFLIPTSAVLLSIFSIFIKFAITGFITFDYTKMGLIDKYLYALLLAGVFFIVLSNILYRTSGHRGITHTPFFYFVVFLLLFLASFVVSINIVGVFFLTGGAMSHIAGDSLTDSGVPLLYPIKKKRYLLAPEGSKKFFATLFVLLSFLLFLAFVFTFVRSYL